MGIGAAIAGAVTGLLTSAGVSVATASVIGTFAVKGLVTGALGLLSSALTPKAKTPNLSGFSAKATGLTQNVQQAITVRRIVYGEVRVGGALTFMETTGDTSFIHYILTVADHKCHELGEIWLDDISIPADYIDSSGNVTQGHFAGKARIKKHLGNPGQLADSDLISEVSGLDANFKGDCVCYLYVRLEYDRDIFPTSLPNVTVFTLGKPIIDTRDQTEKFTMNGAAFVYDYLTLPVEGLTPGVGVDVTDIDETFLNASLNVCDEFVTTQQVVRNFNEVDASIITLSTDDSALVYLRGDKVQLTTTGTLPSGISANTDYFVIPYQRRGVLRLKLADSLENASLGVAVNITDSGSGTHAITKIAEPRYHGGGAIDVDEQTGNNLADILTCIGGSEGLIFVGGQWKIKAASYQTPVYSFDESNIIGQISLRTKASDRDRFNLVRGVYVSPLNEGQPADYPSVTNSTYVSNDLNLVAPAPLDLPLTQRPQTAQRLAKIKLEKHRQELFLQASFDLSAMQVQPGDVILLSNDRLGFTDKPFEVVLWSLKSDIQNNVPVWYIEMSLQETTSAVYDWSSGEETTVDPAPNTTLPNPLIVSPPTGLSASPVEVLTENNDTTYEFNVSWSAPNDVFVTNGGHYDIEFKKSSSTEWLRSYRAEDIDTKITIKQVESAVSYDYRMRSVNSLGVRSAYQELLGFTIASPSGVTSTIDDGQISVTPTTTIDEGLVTDTVTTTIDEGTLS